MADGCSPRALTIKTKSTRNKSPFLLQAAGSQSEQTSQEEYQWASAAWDDPSPPNSLGQIMQHYRVSKFVGFNQCNAYMVGSDEGKVGCGRTAGGCWKFGLLCSNDRC